MINLKKLLLRLTTTVTVNTPIGTIEMYAGATAPSGWKICDGSPLNRTTYAALFQALGGINSPWGLGDGSTTFNLPDFTDRMPVGVGNLYSLNGYGGNKDAIIPYHKHDFTNPTYTVTKGGITNGITGGSHSHDQAHGVRWDGGSVPSMVGYTTASGRGSPVSVTATTHTHSLPDHSHTVTCTENGSVNYNGETVTDKNMPPFRAVNFIIYTGIF